MIAIDKARFPDYYCFIKTVLEESHMCMRRIAKKIIAALLTFCLSISILFGAGLPTAKADALADAQKDLFESTLESTKLLISLGLGSEVELGDYKTIAEQIYNLCRAAYLCYDGLSGACVETVNSHVNTYINYQAIHADNLDLVFRWVMEDINAYGDADWTDARLNQLSELSSMSTSISNARKNVQKSLDDSVFCLFTPNDQETLLKKIIASYDYMMESASTNYAHIYLMMKKAVIANPPTPSFTSVSLTMPTTRTGFTATVNAPAEGVSNMKYIYKWYKDGTLMATQNSTSSKASYTINSAGVWYVDVSIQDSLKQSAKVQSNKITVSQTPINPTKLTMNTTGYTLAPVQTTTLSVAYTPSNTTEKGITWTSSNTAVATVNSSGVVTAVAEGTATITATSKADSSVKATSTITVSGAFEKLYVTDITTTNAQINVDLTKIFSLTECGFWFGTSTSNRIKTVEDLADGTRVKKVFYPLNKWGFTLSPGTTYYYQFYIDNWGLIYYSAVQSFRTPDITVTGIALSNSTLSMDKGDTETLTVTYTPSNATAGKDLVWTSSNPEVASVTGGKITALDGGQTTITAYTTNNNAIAASCTVSVHDPDDDVKLNSVAVSATKLYVGETLSAQINHSGVLGANRFALALYKDDKVYTDYAPIDGTQRSLLLQEPGSYTVKVRITDPYLGEQEVASQSVEVTYRYTALALDKTAVILQSGSTVRVQATVTPGNAALIAHQGTLLASSSQTDIATVVPGSNAATAALYADITGAAPGWCSVYISTGENNGLLRRVDVYVTSASTLRTPTSLTVIGEKAFAGDTTFDTLLALNPASIGSRAFAGCTGLTTAILGEQITSIAADAFDGCDQLTVYCRKDSYAYTFALNNGLSVVAVEP